MKKEKKVLAEVMDSLSKISNRVHNPRRIIREGPHSYIPRKGDPPNETPEDRMRALEVCISDLLEFIDSEELRGAELMASIHGYRVPKEVSDRNALMISDAYKLINKEEERK